VDPSVIRNNMTWTFMAMCCKVDGSPLSLLHESIRENIVEKKLKIKKNRK